jgi:hypothetical protein
MQTTGVKNPKRFVLRVLTLFGAIMFALLGSLQFSLSAFAVGKLEDIAPNGDIDLTQYTFDELCAKGVVFKTDFTAMGHFDTNGNPTAITTDNDKIQRGLYYNFNSAQEYKKWLNDAIEYVALANGYSVSDNATEYKFKAEPKDIGSKSGQEETKAWANYNTVANKIVRVTARGSSESMVGDVFGQDFDPTNAVTVAAMNTFTMVCNSIFNFCAKALMLLFLVQTGFDVIYLVLPFTQGILAPTNASAGGGQAGLAQKPKFAIRFNVVSNEAIEANNRGATGSVGNNGGNGGGIMQTNIALRYLTARAPLIIIAFTYFVLVATNVWSDIITWTTSLITSIFYGL